MIRFEHYGIGTLVTLMVLACGCSEKLISPPLQQVSGDQGDSNQPADLGAEPDVEMAPEQTEPPNDDIRGAEIFTALVKAAEDHDAAGWDKAEKQMRDLGASATSALAVHLTDEDRVGRELASMFLAQLGPDAESASGGLLKLLNDESTFARVNAAAALSTFDGYSERIVPVLNELINDEDETVRLTAVTALRNVGTAAAESVKKLTKALDDSSVQVRAAAAVTLGKLGPLAKSSLPVLRELENAQSVEVSSAAARAIRRIDDDAHDETAGTIPASAIR